MRLYYLDECGFSPSLPTGYSWCLPGQRKRVRYEYPQGRRVNALATYEPFAAAPGLDAAPFERTLTSDDLLAYLRERPPSADVPRVVVLDNAGIHTSTVVRAARPGLAKLGHRPVLPAAVQPGAEPDRGGVQAGQAPRNPDPQLHQPGRTTGGGRTGVRRLPQ